MSGDTTNPEPKRPRVLLITDRVPGFTSGYGIRVANVIDGIAEVAELHVCVIDSSFYGAEFPDDDHYERSILTASELPRWRRGLERVWTIPNLQYLHEADLRRRIQEAIGEEAWDLVWFSRARVHRLCADLFDVPRILDLDDLNDRLLQSLAGERLRQRGWRAVPWSLADRLVARRWAGYYGELDALPDRVVVTHEGDQAHLARLGRADADIVPNGYRPIAEPTPEPTTEHQLLFVGPLSYEPNYLAVRWMVDEVMDRICQQLPDARLAVVGNLRGAPYPPQHEAVEYHGFVHDLEKFYSGATVAVAPLKAGGGTRVKILEAMARQRALVATPFAVEGLGVVDGRDLAVADTPQDFADACVALLTDGDRRAEITKQANATFLAEHTAAHTSRRVTGLVRSALATGARSGDRTDR